MRIQRGERTTKKNRKKGFLEILVWIPLKITKLQSKEGCKDQESIQLSTTPDPGYQWESDKLTVDTTNESQEVSPFPAGDHKAHINRRAQNIANTRQNENIKDPQKKQSQHSMLDHQRRALKWRFAGGPMMDRI